MAGNDLVAKALRASTPSGLQNLTSRWSCRLEWPPGSVECRRCGSLRAGDSAAQLNSVLEFPKLHLDNNASPLGQSSDGKKT